MNREMDAVLEHSRQRRLCKQEGFTPALLLRETDVDTLMLFPRNSFHYVWAMLWLRLDILRMCFLREFPLFRLARWICKRTERRKP